MKWPGISVGKMMLAVAMLAADFALFYHLEHLSSLFSYGMALFIGLLPMINILAFGLPRLLSLGLPRLLRRGRRAPFAVGFQVTSWISTFAVVVIFVTMLEGLTPIFDYLDKYCSFSTSAMTGVYGCKARSIGGPPVAQPTGGLFETCWNVLESLCDAEEFVGVVVVMVVFSLPPFLLSLAGGLVVRSVVRLRSRSVIVSPLPDVAA